MKSALAFALRQLAGIGLVASGFAMTWLYIYVGPRVAMLMAPAPALCVVALIGAECL